MVSKMMLSVLLIISLVNILASQADGQNADPLLYREVNMFTGICWQTVVAEAGIIYTRHVEFGIDLMVNLNCKVTVTAPYDGQRILLNFLTFDVPYSPDCDTDRVMIYDGDNIQADMVTPSLGVCGDSYPKSVNSTGSSLTVQFVTNHNDTQEFLDSTGIVAYFNAFLPETEKSDTLEEVLPDDWKTPFCCHSDHQMCFPLKYTCDSFKNCIDNSDETLPSCQTGGNILDILSNLTGLSQGVLIGLLILLLLILLFIISVIIYFCCCRERKKVKKKIVRKKRYLLKSDYEYDDYRYPQAIAPYDLYYNRSYTKTQSNGAEILDADSNRSSATLVRTDDASATSAASQGLVADGGTLLSTAPIVARVPSTHSRAGDLITTARTRRGDVEHNAAIYGLKPGTGEREMRRPRSLTPQGARRMARHPRSEHASLGSDRSQRHGRLATGSPIVIPRVRAPPRLGGPQRRASFSNDRPLSSRASLRGASFSSEKGLRKVQKTVDRGSSLSIDRLLRRKRETSVAQDVVVRTNLTVDRVSDSTERRTLEGWQSASSVAAPSQHSLEGDDRLWWTTIPASSMSRFHSEGHLEEVDETTGALRHAKRTEITSVSAAISRRWASDIDLQTDLARRRNRQSLNVAHRWLGSRACGKMSLGVKVKDIEIIKLDDDNKTEVLPLGVSDV